MKCPKCHAELSSGQINIQSNIGQCLSCNLVFKISEYIDNQSDDGFDRNNPTQGTWIINDTDKIIIGATTRSPIAFFLVPFMLVWSGGIIGGIYGSQLLNGEFNPLMSVFGIPFIIGSIIFWSFTLMAIWGKVELTLDKTGGKVFTGVGTIGLTKTFTWDEVKTIKENSSLFRYPGSQGGEIQIEGKRRISFGSGINESRKYYLIRAFQSIMLEFK